MTMAGRISGSVIRRKRCQALARSMRAASKMSGGSDDRLASITRNANGVHCQVWIAITEMSASLGSPSQLWEPRPSARVTRSTRPKSGESTKVRQKRPTTTGANTIGRIAATRSALWPRGICSTRSASARPIATCSTTVVPV